MEPARLVKKGLGQRRKAFLPYSLHYERKQTGKETTVMHSTCSEVDGPLLGACGPSKADRCENCAKEDQRWGQSLP